MQKTSGLRSPLARARGLGSAKDGTAHFIASRVTAIALVPLTLWFAFAVIGVAGAGHEAAVAWAAAPINAILLILLVVTTLYHAALGCQVVIEDYVHHEMTKLAAILAVYLACTALGVAGVFAVLKIAFTG
jgi:succinate dehydrogenase / fumarate reductase membrane anchor subunit